MTDQELIQLINEKPAREFTTEELEALRTRWTQSAELRQALIDHLQLETQLTGGLGNVDLDINVILKRAALEKSRNPNKTHQFWKWSLGLSLLLAASIGLGIWFLPARPQKPLAEAKRSATGNADISSPDVVPMVSAQQTLGEVADALQAIAAAEKPLQEAVTPVPVIADSRKNDVPPVEEPWTAALSREVAPWPANSPKLTRPFKASGHDELPESEARRWFSQVEGQPFNWGQDVYGPNHLRVARFHGLARLRAPWPEAALLRLTPFEVTDLTIYLWRGPTGIALKYYTRREPHVWAAFEIVRENSSPKPLRWGLLTTDNGSFMRAGTGTFELRYQDGGVTLARGGIPLLTAPLSGPADEVFVEGQLRIRGISLNKSAPLPTIPENPHPIVVGGVPGELPWAASAESPAEMTTNPDGSTTFRMDSRDKLGTVVLPLQRRGLYEAILRVDSADPGTGLFLGDVDGRPLHRLGFFKETNSNRITIGILRPGENRDQSGFDANSFNAFPTPFHTPTQWIKVVAGLGTVQILVSGDGKQWGHLTENPARDLPGAVASVGLFGLPGPAPRTLKLSRLEVRELSGLTNLISKKLLADAPQFGVDDWKDPVRWTHRVVDSCPARVNLSDWFASCSIASLCQGPPREFAGSLLRRLVTWAVESEVSTQQKLLILQEAAVLSDMWEEASIKPYTELYDVIGTQLLHAMEQHPLSLVRKSYLQAPFWTVSRMRSAWERLNSKELLSTVNRGDWTDGWNLAQATAFWIADPHPDRVPADRADLLARQSRWIKAIAVENAPSLEDGQSGILPSPWRHPLALQWNKEAYNVRSELHSALTGQTYEDACRIVTSINVQDGPGLLPDMEDRQLFVSLPTAVAGAMQTYPQFATLMTDKFGALGLIRVRHAIQTGDVRGIQAATLQFFGTEAAVEAHQWLGDRDLSAGSFPSAEEHYLLALAHASATQVDRLNARLQLAMALNGKTQPSELPSSVSSIELNGTTIPAAELTGLASSLSTRQSPIKRFQHETVTADIAFPRHLYKTETRATFDGQPGTNPGRNEFRFGDPFGRQLSMVADGQRLYVNNRFQVNAYDQSSGQQRWAQGLGSEQGDAHAMPFTPTIPLIAGDRLFVRRITKGGTELACLNSENGNVLWKQRHNLHVLSDPVFWNGSLFALTLGRIDDDLLQVEATRYDFETGAPTSSQPLFRVRDSADRSYAAQLTTSGRLAVCSLPGITACFNGSGEIQWLRKHLWIPKAVDDLYDDSRVAPPLVQGQHVIFSVPGVRSIFCADLETGRQIWTQSFPELKGQITVKQDRLLVETATGITALSLEDGSVAWSRKFNRRLEVVHADNKVIVLGQRIVAAPNQTRASLLWLDLETGREMAQSQVGGTDRDETQLGPMLFAGGKWWGLLGHGWKEAKRDLVEFVPTSSLVPAPFTQPHWGAWTADIPDSQLADLALLLPGWRPELNYGPKLQLATNDIRGESPVISVKLDAAHQFRLAQVIDIPQGRKTSLKLRVGNPQDRKWTLAVKANEQSLLDQVIEETGSANGWRDIVLDLTPFSGQQIPLQLIQSIPAQQPQCDAYWQRASIVIE